MATRQTGFSQSEGSSTTTSATPQNKTSVTFTPDANSDYAIFWCGVIGLTTTGSDVRVYLNDGTTDICTINMEPRDTSNEMAVGGFAVVSFGASPSSTTYTLQYSAEAGTARIQNARLWYIKLDAADQFAVSDGESTTTSSSPQTKVSKTFTPGSTGDYFVFASAEVRSGSTSSPYFINLDVNGTDYDVGDQSAIKDATNYNPWVAFKKFNFAASSQTIKIEYGQTFGSNTTYIRNARVLALRADAFEAAYYAEDLTAQNDSGTTYTTVVSLTETPEAVKHVIFGVSHFQGFSTTANAFHKMTEGGVDGVEGQEEPNDTNNKMLFFTFEEKTLAASSTTWTIQHKYEDANSVTSDDTAIAVLQVEGASTEILGTLSQTLGTLTCSGTGTVKISGTASKTLGALASSATGALAISGTASNTLGTLTSTATGAVAIDGELTATLGTLACSSTIGLTPLNGVTSATLGALALSATGEIDIAGVANATLGSLTSEATGTLSLSGDLDKTLGALLSSGAAGLAIDGELTATLEAVTLSATGEVQAVGTLDATLDALTALATGVIPIDGALTATLGALTVTSAATLSLAGVVNTTLGTLTVSATGELVAPVLGEVDATLGDVTSEATGTLALSGELSQTLGTLVSSGAAGLSVEGELSQTLGDVAASGSGELLIQGSVTQTLGSVTVTATGVLPIVGELSQALESLTCEAAANIAIEGDLNVVLGELESSALGVLLEANGMYYRRRRR